jgi:hypothetical protein
VSVGNSSCVPPGPPADSDQSDTYRHLRPRVTDLLADSGLINKLGLCRAAEDLA